MYLMKTKNHYKLVHEALSFLHLQRDMLYNPDTVVAILFPPWRRKQTTASTHKRLVGAQGWLSMC